MNFFLETLRFIGLLIYLMLESLFLLFIPVRKKNVAGEIVLITGAGSGIGRLMALKFAHLGATLVLWDINQEGNKETARLARKNGTVRVHDYTCDCSKRQEIYRVSDQTVKAFVPAMIASNHGHVVTISSSAGLIGVNGLADYCASKFAAVGFAESLALEMLALGKTGIKSTIVCPYFINTGMFDGCQTKWPLLMPVLDAEYAAEKIVSGILRDQVYVFLPRSMFFLHALKGIIPTKIGVLLGDYLGAFHYMDKFTGRAKKTEDNKSQ
ncbi:epidermal retinol dehydrogenase 2-like isoform X3 [Rhineura floridana]|uniref:epidermal retinol dehydrogenase 2-like isoform X3 n=1 Tax=Rhineura floridana TaxID=261503 RepID=UPI002AC7FE4D|nr:epidermal retinol dehydrogenase 2-like isoform X3 [Rhineura floridana]